MHYILGLLLVLLVFVGLPVLVVLLLICGGGGC